MIETEENRDIGVGKERERDLYHSSAALLGFLPCRRRWGVGLNLGAFAW